MLFSLRWWILLSLGLGLLGSKAALGDFEPGQLETRTLEWEGVQRTYDVYRPVGSIGPDGLSVLFDFHGFSSNSAQQRAVSTFRELADSEFFLAVWPQGTGATPGWNAGFCCVAGVDDVGFVRAVVDSLAEEVSLNPGRIYATGLSNGGALSHRLACEAADLFAAVAPMAFPLPFFSPSACQPSRPIPVGMVMGLTDVVVPYSGSGFGNALDSLAFWRDQNGCGNGEPDIVVPLLGDADCRVYTHCDEDVETQLCSIVGWDFAGTAYEAFAGHILYYNTSGLSVGLDSWDFMNSFEHPDPPVLPVPEPNRASLFITGALGIVLVSRVRHNRRSARGAQEGRRKSRL